MRPVPAKPISVKGRVLGGPTPLLCVPLVGKSREDVLAEVHNLDSAAPDIIELRVDAWDCVEDHEKSASLLREARSLVDMPIILTCRGHWEGGVKEVSEAAKDAIYETGIKEKLVDFVDKELSYEEQKLSRWKALANSNGISLILSYHNFHRTPSKEFIYSRLAQQVRCGADVAKAALMPEREEDVLSLLAATLAARRDFPETPMITMSMGPLGTHSRVVGGLYGSDLTFAVGSAASAPGQIPVGQMRSAFKLMYG
ncbi:MAG: type I 3-dehydroquinate dehydratase [Synergistaceae bacterium]|jgi:3-dehydroquinate dehydratase-1|nr:type I 3-dehydroquinate dehydratase [Synergistaceae bacterium]